MVTILISADSKFPISRPKIKAAVEAVLRERKVTSDVEISVLVCGSRKSSELAKKYFSDPEPHNVLSFPLADEGAGMISPTARSAKGFVESPDGVLVLGDIVVCYPLAQEEANEDNVLVGDKVAELVTHGLFHLLGEHHEE